MCDVLAVASQRQSPVCHCLLGCVDMGQQSFEPIGGAHRVVFVQPLLYERRISADGVTYGAIRLTSNLGLKLCVLIIDISCLD